jgi:hypothetical protein
MGSGRCQNIEASRSMRPPMRRASGAAHTNARSRPMGGVQQASNTAQYEVDHRATPVIIASSVLTPTIVVVVMLHRDRRESPDKIGARLVRIAGLEETLAIVHS